MRAFQTDEQRGTAGGWPFQEQVLLQCRDEFVGQWQQPGAAALAHHAQVRFGGLEVIELEAQDFTTAQTVEQHQAHDGEIAESVEAAPEARNLLGGKGLDEATRLLESQSAADDAAWAAVAECRSLRIATLEMRVTGRDLLALMKTIEPLDDDETAIDGFWGRRWSLVQLVADIILERRLGECGERMRWRREGPAGEVEQIKGIGTQRTRRQLAQSLRIQECVRPQDLLAASIEQAIRRSAGRKRWLMRDGEFHEGSACCRQRAKSLAVAPARK